MVQAWTPARARARCRRRIAKVKTALLDVAYEWGDVDENVVRRADELRAELDDLNKTIDDAVEYQAERDRERAEEQKPGGAA